MSTNLSPVLKQRFFDTNGNPLAGGKLYSYQAGTTTPQATYTDSTGGTPNANPVVLDANGEANVWLDPTLSYKFILKTSADVSQWTTDNVIGTLAAGSVLTASIADGAVTKAKLATGARDINVVTANTTGSVAVTTDLELISASSGSIIRTLPSAASVQGRIFTLQRTDDTPANSVTISPAIGGSTRKLMTVNESVTVVSDGSVYKVLQHKCNTEWTAYTPTFTGLGTVSSVNIFYKRNGGNLEVKGTVSIGTTSAALASASIPTSLAIDAARTVNNTTALSGEPTGKWVHNGTANEQGHMFPCPATSTTLVYMGTSTTGVSMLVAQNGNAILTSANALGIQFSVPITDWWE